MARAKPPEKPIGALAYLRTSSAQNVGGDSDVRQREAVQRFAKAHMYVLADEFYDAAVSGVDPIKIRPGFPAMLERVEANGVRVVLVEDASRFARCVIAHKLGVLALQVRGMRVLAATGEGLTNSDDPAKLKMRPIAGILADYDKVRVEAKLKGARDRMSEQLARRVEDCKSYTVLALESVREARRLPRRNPTTCEYRSLRRIACELERLCHLN